jgi:hypothetical protein
MKKKLLVLLGVGVCLAGCGGASQSGVWEHPTLYRNVDHLRFSWGGHDDAGREDVKKSAEQGWWGKEVEVPAALGK